MLIARHTAARVVALIALLAACRPDGAPERASESAASHRQPDADSARRAFGDATVEQLLDTHLHELRGQLSVKERNPNRDDESPLVDRDITAGAAPGPHTYLGVLHAELGTLRTVLGDTLPVSVDGERVYVGRPEVLVLGHRHGDALFVPVKLFARPYGAYVRVNCPLANCGSIWRRDILLFMRRGGNVGSAGVIEGYVEGLIDSVDVRARPGG